MAYTPTYETSDVAPITIDMIATLMVEFVTQMPQIAQFIVLGVLLGLIVSALVGVGAILKSLTTRFKFS